MTSLEAIAAMTPFAALTSPLSYNYAARCARCGWISKATPRIELLPEACPNGCPPRKES